MYNKSVNMDFNWSKLLKEAPFSAFTKKGASFDSMPYYTGSVDQLMALYLSYAQKTYSRCKLSS